VARHAKASRVRIRIGVTPGADLQQLEASIADNGVGADLSLPRAGLGLVGMRERVATLGGSVKLQSAPGAGFEVKAWLPMR